MGVHLNFYEAPGQPDSQRLVAQGGGAEDYADYTAKGRDVRQLYIIAWPTYLIPAIDYWTLNRCKLLYFILYFAVSCWRSFCFQMKIAQIDTIRNSNLSFQHQS